MNFVDVQPKSFLDYAWTTPSPAPAVSAKPSKTSRRQNRCCDQCRKGKRACDAAILEDTLLDTNGSSGESPSVFHYSDVFGPLAPCGNCDKTRKTCTFDWLRTQRVLQATPQSVAGPPAKRRRKSSSSKSPQNRKDTVQQLRAAAAPQPTALPEMGPTSDAKPTNMKSEVVEYGLTFADFPGQIPAFDLSVPTATRDTEDVAWSSMYSDSLSNVLEDEEDVEEEAEHDSGKGSSIDTRSEEMDDRLASDSPSSSYSRTAPTSRHSRSIGPMSKPTRKRRRRGSCSMITNGSKYCASSYLDKFLSSSDQALLADGLLKIYHDSFENALSCWLTERTCPYSEGSELSLAKDAGPDWNRIYHRVFRLDQLALSVQGKGLSFPEDKAASKALNLAIFAFATQWAQSSGRSKAKYPFHNGRAGEGRDMFGTSGDVKADQAAHEFDRALQISAWREAQLALQQAAKIESFRIVLAQLVFSLTQRPSELIGEKRVAGSETDQHSVPTRNQDGSLAQRSDNAPTASDDQAANECGDLLARLHLTIDQDGPPVHLEQGLRLIHSLRSRMTMCGGLRTRPPKKNFPCRENSSRVASNHLDAADQATVDLLFWLGVMFDTLSSAMYKRPLVVSDEDSEIYSKQPRPIVASQSESKKNGEINDGSKEEEGLWDSYLFARQRKRLQGRLIRWPCSFEQASSLLCDAAPVKVLLFRKVTRIQTLLSRGARGERVEKAVKAALKVHDHWEKLYAPFMRDCIENHDRLPPRIQSWYICVAGHWHLATLLLADLIEIIDSTEVGSEVHRRERISDNFVACLRRRSCYLLSDLASCACPRNDATFSKSGEFHFAVSQGALLTEPWTAVLIRAFATAGVVLLESEEHPGREEYCQEDSFRRADACVQALWYLGRKSDMALSAAKILGDALKQRRKTADEKVNDMSSFLEAELWEGFEEMNEAFGVECV